MSNKINNPNDNSDNLQIDDDQETQLLTNTPANMVTGQLNPASLPPSAQSTDDTDKPNDIQSKSEKADDPTQSDSSNTESVSQTPSDKLVETPPTTEQSDDKVSEHTPETTPDEPAESQPAIEQTASAEQTDMDQTDVAQAEDPNKTAPDNSKDIEFDSDTTHPDNNSKTYPKRSRVDSDVLKASFLSFNKKKDEASPQSNPDTAVLSGKSPTWKKIIDGQAQGGTSTLGEQREVLFVIRGMIERVVMKDNSIVTLGRFDTGTVPNEEIDLIPYGAIDRGVSRRHCKIQLQENQLYVVDLESTNGTFLAGVRLKAQSPEILRKGDELLLGRLAVQVLFR